MEECLEIIFTMKGVVQVGYEINKNRFFAIKMDANDSFSSGCVIGGYNVTFYKRSNYLW